MKIPTNVPVFIQDIKKDETNRYSTAKLRVFYVGETADKRLFTKDFSDKLLTTLPSTPVVGFYSEDKDDFIGHNKVQYVYGHVPENATIEYENDTEGKMWAITDVILYTERNDNISEVAKKIVGKQHSLEMNPNTLTYKVHRGPHGEFRNLEFTSGEFIGLSVLGDNENPAFTGSGFFSLEENPDLAVSFNNFLNFLNNNGGNIEVFNFEEFCKQTSETMFKSMQQFQQDIYEVMSRQGIYGLLVENTEDYAVIDTWDEDTEQWGYYKYNIVKDGDSIAKLDRVEKVYIHYVTKDELDALEQKDTVFAADIVNNSEQSEPEQIEQSVAESVELEQSVVESVESQCAEETTEEIAKSEGETDAAQTIQEEDVQPESKTDSCSAALIDSERAELEQYRLQAKQRAINEYKETLGEEIINSFVTAINDYSLEELESKLALAFAKAYKEGKVKVAQDEQLTQPTIQTFSIITSEDNYDESNPTDVVKKYNR